jgi:molecular chaperone IbpA
MRSAFDFSPFRRSSVGFDRLFDMLESSATGGATENYPPFDLIREDENKYRIEIAVAGFRRNEIEITAHQNVLIIRGQKSEETGNNYVHRGIATRSFERRFALADHIQVTGAEMHDGMLSLELLREIPEAMKPRKIEIGGRASGERQTIDAPAAEREPVKETENA